tara:strand:+ start:306 stop:965 length:660 start_codon:yes stop_codon:yes gene_type:complete
MSTIKVNNIDTQSGSTVTLPTGKVLTITDAGGISIGGTVITSSGAELNVLDGIPAGLTATELGYVDGVTSALQTQLNAKLALAGGTMSGETIFADQLATKPKMKDYSEAINVIGSITSGTDADLEDGNVQTVTMTANTFNFGITNGLASNSNSLTLVITNGGLATVTWKAGAHGGGGNNIKWAGGSAPTLTNSGVDVICFTTVDGGTNFYGFSAGLDMS